jgi:uroporphyrinogen decarboxylase
MYFPESGAKLSMKSRERVLNALKRQPTDRVPYCELFVDVSMAEKLLNRSLGTQGTAGTMRKYPYTAEQAIDVARFLGLDNLTYVLRAHDYTKVVTDSTGRTFPGEGLIKSESDVEMIKLPDNTKDEFYRDAEEFVKKKGDYACNISTRVGLSQAMLSLGVENFSLLLYDNPKLVEKILDIYLDWTAVMAARICQLGFDFFWTTDDYAFKTGMFFSPNMFRELLFKRYRRVLDKLSIPWVLHSDGNMEASVPMLIELGVAGIHPIEKGAMDIAQVKKRYSDHVCVMGNVDLVTLGKGTQEQVDAEVKDLMQTIGPGGGYIITSGNSLASYLKPENVVAMAEAIRKYGAYPIQAG